jgi:NAD(P)-dependent dehydrogenase (short-subunit alcohol dehydrogenase family)
MRRKLAGKVVVVTGASSGVGRAIARAFGARGAKVGLIARTPEALENCAEEIRWSGGDALVLALDVADAAAVDRAADEVIARWGRIDVWVNDAMVSVFSPAKEMRPEEYRRVTEVNYLGSVYGTLSALKHMLPRDEGHVIQVGSALAYRSIPLQSAYCASKAALRGFTDSLRCELLHDRSQVKLSMIVCQRLVPGLVDRYLGRTGYTSQQTDQPAPPNRPDNVDAPIPGDRGAHGDFDERARRFSLELGLRTRWLALATMAALGAGAMALRRA